MANAVNVLFLIGGIALGGCAVDSACNTDDNLVSIALATCAAFLIFASGVIKYASEVTASLGAF